MADRTSVGEIALGINVDTSSIDRSINNMVSNVNGRLTSGFNNSARNVRSSLNSISREIERSTNTLERQEQQIQNSENRLATLNATLSRLTTKYSQQNISIQEQESLIADLQNRYEQLANSTEQPTNNIQQEMQRLSRQIENARNRLQNLNNASTATRDRMNEVSRNIAATNNNLENLRRHAASSQQRIENLTDELVAMNEAGNNLEESISGLNEGIAEQNELIRGQSDVINRGVSVFENCGNKIVNFAKKAAVALAGAFAVDKIIDFGKQCLDLGSDLAEVQNVVDVTFPNMTKQVDKFAKNAISSFGLSETMAKKFTGTFGSMAEAFGFSEKESYKMATALTGLSGDVASFYNISQDEAYTKLKSVFSGETETLKDLGIVMTQSALDAYALANGYGKTTAKMTEAEKVSLRFAFVQEKLSNATGDFIRTSNSWANQIRILSLQFDSLKASIGQGLINVFTPVIKWMNLLLLKITVVADKFKEFTELITGNKGSDSSSGSSTAAAETADSMSSASESAASTADSTSKTAKNLKKASRFLAGFDKITKMNSKDKTSDSGKTGGAGVGSGSGVKVKVDTSNLDKTSKKLDKLKNAFLALKNRFVKGFKIGLGDISVLDGIKENIKSINQSIWDIASDKEVQAALNNMFLSLAESTGKIAGSFASIGLTIADNLTGGISKYLKQNTGRIKKYLISMFDIIADIESIRANFIVAVADIFAVFRSDDAKQITADCIKIFADAFMGVTELSGKLGRDVLQFITQPIIENSEKIKKALSNTLKLIKNIINTIATTVEKTIDKINQVYDEKISPALKDVTDSIADIVKTVLNNYNQYIAPVLNSLTKEFSKMWDSCIQPALNKAVELIGNIVSCVSAFWSNVLSPFIKWIIDTIVPVIMPAIQQVGKTTIKVFGNISKMVGSTLEVFNGLLEFVTGVFKCDWKKAWNGIKKIFKGFKDGIGNIIKTLLSVFQLQFIKIKSAVVTPFKAIKKVAIDIWNFIKDKVLSVVDSIKEKVAPQLNSVKEIFTKAFSGIKKSVVKIFDAMWTNGIKKTINTMLSGIEKMINAVVDGFNKMIDSLNHINIKTPDWSWLPKKFRGKTYSLDLKQLNHVEIPPLAKGGYVKANTPQLAMIGDNRHQGEYVAPEGMLYDLICKAVKNSSKNNNTNNTTQQEKDINLNLVLEIGGTKFANIVAKAINQESRRQGKCIIKTT